MSARFVEHFYCVPIKFAILANTSLRKVFDEHTRRDTEKHDATTAFDNVDGAEFERRSAVVLTGLASSTQWAHQDATGRRLFPLSFFVDGETVQPFSPAPHERGHVRKPVRDSRPIARRWTPGDTSEVTARGRKRPRLNVRVSCRT